MEGAGHSDTGTMSMTPPHLKRKRSLSGDQQHHQAPRHAPDVRPPRPIAGNHAVATVSTGTGAAGPSAPVAPAAHAANAGVAAPRAAAPAPSPSTANAPKPAKQSHNHLQINYLARQNREDLALAATQDTMPEIIELVNQYQGVLDRHESLACNLGARPLGPILIKRFERLFDGPPRVLKSHGKEGAAQQHVTWLDVVEFARNKPEQFTLGQVSEGRKVCQFYTKQSRVQISEDDYVLLNSGIPQKMIPPQPIVEDEEKELGTLEILEERLGKICQLADQVAARTRQLNHRIKGRKQAILDRRATEPSFRPMSPSHNAGANGGAGTVGFVTVSSRPNDASGSDYSKSGASAATRHELLERFASLGEQRAGTFQGDGGGQGGPAPTSTSVAHGAAGQHHGAPPDQELAALLMASNNTQHSQLQASYGGTGSAPGLGPAPNLPAAPSYMPDHNGSSPGHYQHQPHPSSATQASHVQMPGQPQRNNSFAGVEKDRPDDGPFKAEMVARMEQLGKGERVVPPCDRCRRLHMDCLKNLTACAGCTKKHAKCSWRDVRGDEMLHAAEGRAQGVSARGEGGLSSAAHHEDVHMGDANTPSPRYEHGHDGYMAAYAPAGSSTEYAHADHAYGHRSAEASPRETPVQAAAEVAPSSSASHQQGAQDPHGAEETHNNHTESAGQVEASRLQAMEKWNRLQKREDWYRARLLSRRAGLDDPGAYHRQQRSDEAVEEHEPPAVMDPESAARASPPPGGAASSKEPAYPQQRELPQPSALAPIHSQAVPSPMSAPAVPPPPTASAAAAAAATPTARDEHVAAR